MNANTTKTIIGTLLPFASNPVVLTILGVGATAWAIASIFDNDNEDESNGSNAPENRSEPSKQPLKPNRSTVQSTVREPLETVDVTVVETVEARAEEPFVSAFAAEAVDASTHLHQGNSANLSNEQAITIEATPFDDDAVKKEMIKRTMSELGKRSGVARRKKSQTKLGRQ